MTIKKNKFIEVESNKEELIIQANNGDHIFVLLQTLIHSPKSKEEIATIFGFDERQAEYYSSALNAMQLTEIYEYNSKNLTGLSEKGSQICKKLTKQTLAKYIEDIDFIENQKELIAESSFAEATKDRRMSSVNAIQKWIKENK